MKASLNYTDLIIILVYLTSIVLWALRKRQAGSSEAFKTGFAVIGNVFLDVAALSFKAEQ